MIKIRRVVVMKSREEGKERKAGEKGKRFKRFKITLPLINNYEHYNADACTLAKVKKKVLTTAPS